MVPYQPCVSAAELTETVWPVDMMLLLSTMLVAAIPTLSPSTTTAPPEVVSVAQIAVAVLVAAADVIALNVKTPPEEAGAAVADRARSAMMVPEHVDVPIGYIRSRPEVPIAVVMASIRVFLSAVE